MAQLSLNIAPRLVYSSNGFLLHAGVKELFERCVIALTQGHFALTYISGGPRTGKSHLAVALADALAAQGFTVFALEGGDLSDWVSDRISRTVVRSHEAVVVDDAHLYLEGIEPGRSGEFVNMVEAFRRGKGRIALISAKEAHEFGFDDHVRSRILPGTGYAIGAPGEDDLPRLFSLMARQRGMLFSTRKLEYFMKRIGRDIAAIDACLCGLDVLAKEAEAEEQLPLIESAPPQKLP